MGINEDSSNFLTQEEHELFLITQTELESKEYNDYKLGFEKYILEFHKQYDLKSKKTMVSQIERIITTMPRKL